MAFVGDVAVKELSVAGNDAEVAAGARSEGDPRDVVSCGDKVSHYLVAFIWYVG